MTARVTCLAALVGCTPATVADDGTGVDVTHGDGPILSLPSRQAVRRRLVGRRGRQSGAVRYLDGGFLVQGTTGDPEVLSLPCDPLPDALRFQLTEDGPRLAIGPDLPSTVDDGDLAGTWDLEGDVVVGLATLVEPAHPDCDTLGDVSIRWAFDPDRIATVPRPGTRPAPDQRSGSR